MASPFSSTHVATVFISVSSKGGRDKVWISTPNGARTPGKDFGSSIQKGFYLSPWFTEYVFYSQIHNITAIGDTAVLATADYFADPKRICWGE